jgi:hypothetical protein
MHIVRLVTLTALILTILIAFFLVSGGAVYALDDDVFLREDFNDLQDWEPLYFTKIEEHTLYSIKKEDGSYLKAESNASASGIVYKKEFNVFDYPMVRWRWKVTNVYDKGDAETKSGDDYPIRIYIMFKYDPDTASLGRRIKYGLAKKLYGKYPPDSSLNYIWANRRHEKRFLTNTYASEAVMVPLQHGMENAGRWVSQAVNIIDDYRKAFGSDPPAVASLAVMNDSDNTKEGSVSYIDFIEVYK